MSRTILNDKKEDGVLEERINGITNESFREVMSLDKKSRPKEIYLYGANPSYLVKVMLRLQDRFKKEKYNPTVFLGCPDHGGYSINVGHYLNPDNLEGI